MKRLRMLPVFLCAVVGFSIPQTAPLPFLVTPMDGDMGRNGILPHTHESRGASTTILGEHGRREAAAPPAIRLGADKWLSKIQIDSLQHDGTLNKQYIALFTRDPRQQTRIAELLERVGSQVAQREKMSITYVWSEEGSVIGFRLPQKDLSALHNELHEGLSDVLGEALATSFLQGHQAEYLNILWFGLFGQHDRVYRVVHSEEHPEFIRLFFGLGEDLSRADTMLFSGKLEDLPSWSQHLIVVQ